MTLHRHPRIKVCGLTRPDEARTVAELGADAVGLVFYPKSPRNVTVQQAAQIVAALPPAVPAVAVMVNPTLEDLIRVVRDGGLHTVQLHGAESPEFIADVRQATDARIVKALFAAKAPALADAGRYTVDGYLVECGKGPLPGGNAMAWDWSAALDFGRRYPVALAGGLEPENVADAIAGSLPDAVDASSGLEAGPGRKDMQKVARFIEQVRRTADLYRAKNKIVTPIF